MPDLTITVKRTGGFAGLTREWSAVGPRDEWLPLVEACPWRSVPRDTQSRDRFVYVISVRTARTRKKAEVPESALTGPWRDLVERVQSA